MTEIFRSECLERSRQADAFPVIQDRRDAGDAVEAEAGNVDDFVGRISRLDIGDGIFDDIFQAPVGPEIGRDEIGHERPDRAGLARHDRIRSVHRHYRRAEHAPS